jgi:hypothetical protein
VSKETTIEEHIERARELIEHVLTQIDHCDRADIKFALWQARDELAMVLAVDVQNA